MFSPLTKAWFEAAFPSPTEIQRRGWEAIARGDHSLLIAPTGSGKTLAAFLIGIDRCLTLPPDAAPGVRVLYVSPLKALVYDVERNLRAPLNGIRRLAEAQGQSLREIAVDVRTGDTPAPARRRQARAPADILVTTPESLFLLLASRARETLRSVHTVIVDEVHALAPVKRGAHLALSLEWLAEITPREPQRIGLSATVRPTELTAAWLGGGRAVCVVDAAQPPALDLCVVMPAAEAAGDDAPPVAAGGSLLARLYRQGLEQPQSHARSLWPRLYAALYAEVRAARASIVFVNSRAQSERLAQQLNALAGETIAHAHHGSLSRERRLELEDALKSGQIRVLVATSSLELGIDMGAVDKVLMLSSPGSVARGLQRAGRAGHAVGEVSRARIYPKFKGDLLECALIAGRMLRGEIEAIAVPENPLDVLAQHVTAWVDAAPLTVEAILQRARRCHNFRALGRSLLEGVLAMLAGAYAAGELAEYRPLVSWDRACDRVSARRGAGMIVRLNAGVIPDRGLYPVYLGEGGPRLGELDEEMVYESRKGDVIQLGANSWRIEAITRDRVLVSPAPGEAGRLPFWRGDAPGRSLELGRALGAFLRAAGGVAHAQLAAWLRAQAPLDDEAARELAEYIEEQRTVSVLPTDRTVVVERFRDELGDWRVCVLSPFGARLHAPWAIALQHTLSVQAGYDIQVLYTDDGLVVRFADADSPPDSTLLFPDPEEVAERIAEQLPHTALFAGLFRENAARALLTPRRHADRRRPLWAQRIKAQRLMATVARHADFPIVLETYRQALADLFDLQGLRQVLTDIQAGRIRVREVQTSAASPFARSLTFAYVAANLYAGDVPLAERRAQALTLDKRMLAELLGESALAELLDAGAIVEVEQRLQRLVPGQRARDAEALHDLLRQLGDLTLQEIAARCEPGEAAIVQDWLQALAASRRAARVSIAGEWRWIAAEDAGLYRDALGVPSPSGLPSACLAPVEDALVRLIHRWARRRGPFTAEDLARRYGLVAAQVEPVLQLLEREGVLQYGRIRPDLADGQWVEVEVLRQLKRASVARLRREAVPQDAAALARHLSAWQGVAGEVGAPVRPTPERLLEAILPLEALALPWSSLVRTLLPMRLPGFALEQLDVLAHSGQLVWLGAGALGARDGRIMLVRREQVARLFAPTPYTPPTALHACILQRLQERGAQFLTELEAAVVRLTPGVQPGEFEAALWDLVWAGRVSNDGFAPLRQLQRGALAAGRRHASQLLAGGRWYLTAELIPSSTDAAEQALAWAELLLARYGLVCRETVRAEQIPVTWSVLRQVLQAMEDRGRVRRGYFVEGLSGTQYARAGAVESLRRRSEQEPEAGARVLAAVDPANPYGALLPWPESTAGGAQPRRVPGAWVVLVEGRLALYLQPGGQALLSFPGQLDDPGRDLPMALRALADLPPGARRRFILSRVDGRDVRDSPLHAELLAQGFRPDYGGLCPPAA
ncbi:MAG: DEAD/DEAH box helicase [Thiobacillaceae bacterium]|nr:DEAD/DEAH box helicase [Thiobacillaceae bacterium]